MRWSALALLLTLFGFARVAAATPEAEDDKPSDEKVHLEFESLSLGYQGNLTTQRYAAPGGAAVEVQRHGGELGGGGVVAIIKRSRPITSFHTLHGRASFLFGGTPTPDVANAGPATVVPRHGFNFGLWSASRENAGIAIGGVCGVALSGIGGESVKAYTRSTVPGNHLLLDAGFAGGLQCGWGHNFVLVEYGITGNLGVEQMQDLAYQQGNDLYRPRQGNGLLLFGAHGPVAFFVHDSRFAHAVFAAEYSRTIGRGKWGGRRQTLRGQLAVAFGEKTAFGFGPWYELGIIDYGEASKVTDPNTRWGHTFGFTFVAALQRSKQTAD